MEIIEKREYSYKEIQIKEIVENKVFKKCKFNTCKLSYLKSDNPSEASIVRNCEFIDCHATENTSQTGGILKNVLIHNLKNTGVLFFKNVLFDKVVFKGSIGKISLDSKISDLSYIFEKSGNRHEITEQEMLRYEEFRIKFYQNVEFALDISEAEFKYCEINPSIPAKLIKRNPETQVLVNYDKILKSNWKANPTLANDFIINLRFQKAINTKSDIIIVAPVLDKREFTEYMELIKILRGEGIAELD